MIEFSPPVLLLVVLWLLTVCSSNAESEFGFAISQDGLDQLGRFGLRKGFELLDNQPLALNVRSHSTDDTGSMAYIDVTNIVDMQDISFKLTDDLLEVFLYNFTLVSEANVTAEVWPLPVTEETVTFDIRFKQAHISIAPVIKYANETLTEGNSNGTRRLMYGMKLVDCHFEDPIVDSRTKNYWLFDTSMKIGGGFVQSNFESILCPQIHTAFAGASGNLEKLASTLEIAVLAGADAKLPPLLGNASLHYYISDMQIRANHASLRIALEWTLPDSFEPPFIRDMFNATGGYVDEIMDANDTLATNNTLNETSALFQMTQTGDRRHLSVWIEDSFFNDFLSLLEWDIMLINVSVPVKGEMIPIKSRRFLTTMCHDCHFQLSVHLNGQPVLLAGLNDSAVIDIVTNQRVNMIVVNPATERSGSFMAFSLMFHTRIEPYIEEGIIKVALNLVNASTTLNSESSAFPPEWSFFMEDLVNGMIKNMVWPQIKEKVENITQAVGIGMSRHCGVDPDSAQIHIAPGMIGFSSDLVLENFSETKCVEDFEKGEFMSMVEQAGKEPPI